MTRCVIALLVALQAAAATAEAQVVRGRLVGASSERPVAAAFVILERPDSTRAGSALSDDTGEFAVRAQPGTYRLRIERLGLAAQTTEWFDLGAGDGVVQNVRLTEQALSLPSLQVTAARSGCRSTGELGADAALLWEEARKALDVAAWTARTQPIRAVLKRSLRERRVNTTRTTLQVTDSTLVETTGSPWRSAPAEELKQLGFVRRQGEGYLYYGPDAELLLSSAFLASHCFELTANRDDASLVGLRFRPRSTPRVTDIAGVLWLRRDDITLHSLQFDYVNLPYRAPESVGGDVRFLRLPNGAWIVAGWRVKSARAEEQPIATSRPALLMSEHRYDLVDALDAEGRSLLGTGRVESGRVAAASDLPIPGGSISAVIWAAQRCGRTPAPERAHATGVVTDEAGTPLRGAAVRISVWLRGQWAIYDTTTDANGYYRVCDVPSGPPLKVEAAAPDFESGARELHGFDGSLLRVDFRLVRLASVAR